VRVTKVKDKDPRVKRTRQLLQHALMDLVQQKSFQHISVQEIAEEATVNRATFYAHYEDKYALMDDCVHERFQQMLTKRLTATSTLRVSTLRMLIQTVFDFLALIPAHTCGSVDRQLDPLIEAAVQQEVDKMLLTWLKRLPARSLRQRVPVETIATVMSCAICGSAIQWNHGEKAASAEEMAGQVQIVITNGLLHTIQIASLED
jgi:AcrR family transcriptional regulator